MKIKLDQNNILLLLLTTTIWILTGGGMKNTNLVQNQFLSETYCDTIRNFCDRVQCEPPEKCEDGIVLKGGGVCGCCDVCLQYIGYGKECAGDAEWPIAIPLGNIAQYIYFDTCLPGYDCNGTNTCTTTNLPSVKNSLCPFLKYDSPNTEWELAPNCDPYGYFDYKRCKGRDNPRCYCVNPDGDTIFGRITQNDADATCYCSRAVDSLEKSTATFKDDPNIRCAQNGDFATLQCWDDICFCINKTTLEIAENAVPISAITALPCYNDTLYSTDYYETCESEKVKMNQILKDFTKKGITTILIDMPACDPDGTYSPVQYDGKQWICSDRNGKQINSYSIQDETHENMICNCARDQYYSDGLPPSASPNCDSFGNYDITKPICFNNIDCYCVDSDGQRRTNDFPKTKDNTCPN